MWRIDGRDILRLRGGGGEPFTKFVDLLVRSQASLGLPDSQIRTNIRTNIGDEGVDTEVCRPIPNDPTGWLGDNPTILQYKATEYTNVTCTDISDEVKKEYVKTCIKNGYAYHICICDDLPPNKKEDREKCLNESIKEINPNAPTGKIISASDLAAWANRFPAVVLEYFRPGMIQSCLHFKAWGDNITSLTQKYVTIPTFESISNQIIHHANFKNDVPEIALPISGEAGVGKTRLVYESLKDMSDFVIYTDDEQKAREIARFLANDSSLRAILVADECSLDGFLHLKEGLRGVKDRVRVITIDNSGERPFSESPEPWLEKIPPTFVEEILEKNYPNVPLDRRRTYAEMAGGFVRLAVYFCNNDDSIVHAGNVGPILGSILADLNCRLSENQMEVLQALSLVTKVGMKDNVAQELNDLCNLVGIDTRQFKEIANKLHDNPGFIGRGGRFFYVTPEIIAQVGFESAWRRWAKTDPEDFLKRIPPSILESFYKRASKSAPEGVRQIIGNTFLIWATDIKPEHLASVETMDQIVTLIEVEPTRYLPILRRLIEEATIEELKCITGDSYRDRWGPRRSLVWLAEKMAAFPEHFDDAERILFRLALAESEPSISNNATNTWKGLFSIFLSGTAVSFEERLLRLEMRILNNDDGVPTFAIDALDGAFRSNFMRHAGPSVVAGKITPVDWRPSDDNEYKKCIDSSVLLLEKLTDKKLFPPEVVIYSQKFAIKNTRFLLKYGYLSHLNTIFSDPLSDDTRVELIQSVENFLRYAIKKGNSSAPSVSYLGEVKDWLESLKPLDFHGKLVYLIGSNQFHYVDSDRENNWRAEIRSLATECIENQDTLKKEADWLYSSNAKNALILGQELGNLDGEADLLDFIFKSSIRFESVELARGYVYSHLEKFPHHAVIINEKIDRILEESPEIGYELYMAGGTLTNAFQRTIRLVDDKKLSAKYLGGLMFGAFGRDLTPDKLQQILERLSEDIENGDASAIQISLQFLHFQLKDKSKKGEESILEQPNIREFAWHLVEVASLNDAMESYYWTEIIEALVPYDAERAIKVVSRGLLGDDINFEETCKEILISLALKYPKLVMHHVGELILDDSTGWRFISGAYRNFIQSLPSEIVIDWIKTLGIKAARKLAGNLPAPFVDDNNDPTVPHLTEFVLRTFEDDEEVFNEFTFGVGNLRGYSGTSEDIVAQHEREAEIAQKFLDHPLRRVREWAQDEEEYARNLADRERQFGEERRLG
jgi:hypothetical protein